MSNDGPRIVSMTIVVRAGQGDWRETQTTVSVEVEPEWPVHIALAAAQGGLRSVLADVEQRFNEAVRMQEVIAETDGPEVDPGLDGQSRKRD